MANIKEEQDFIKDAWKKSDKKGDESDELLFLIEEIGEMAEAIRKMRGKKENKDFIPDLEKEFGDIMICLYTLAIRHNIDLEKAYERAKESALKRYVKKE